MNQSAILLKNVGDAVLRYPEQNWRDALSTGQLQSKGWLVDVLAGLDRDLGTVFVLAGWLGILPAMMLAEERLRLRTIRSFDIDPSCAVVADTANRDPHVIEGWRFKATTADVFALDYEETTYTTARFDGSRVTLTERADTIVCTSCDHLHPFEDFYNRLPKRRLLVLQNNNFVEADETHTNTVPDLGSFAAQTPMSRTLFEGSLTLPGYTRFMRIGFK